MYKYNPGDVFVFNKNYSLKNDKKRFLIFQTDVHEFLYPDKENPSEDINGTIHPLLALFFALFNGKRTLADVVGDYSKLTGADAGSIRKFAEKTLNEISGNKKGKYIKFDENLFYIPSNVIVKANHKLEDAGGEVDFKDFLIPKKDLDFHSFRYYSPLDCIFEVNFTCYTDCVYCYADRRIPAQCSIPINRLKEIIREARKIGMRTFDLCGGELFLYEKWDVLAAELLANNFKPYISTKIPLSEETVKRLKGVGIKEIQISLDSIKKDELKRILNVNGNYLDSMVETIKCLEKEDFKIFINGQISRLNGSPENVKEMLDFLLNFPNINSIKFGPIGYSLYRPGGNFEKISPSLASVKKIQEIIEIYKQEHQNVSINFSGYSERDVYVNDSKKKEERFKERAKCSGNFYAFVILPDGRVTICEELYFHPAFIIGDLKTQSIEEVWNSERAIELYRLSQERIKKESACKACEESDRCRQQKGVCWKEILYAYGNENWDYPDPKCPHAPEPKNRFWLE